MYFALDLAAETMLINSHIAIETTNNDKCLESRVWMHEKFQVAEGKFFENTTGE